MKAYETAAEPEKALLQDPPRFLLGAAFLFWGVMLDQGALALGGALFLEGRWFFSTRWKVGEGGFVKAWQLVMLLLLVTAIVRLMGDEDRIASSIGVLSFLPVVFLPLLLVAQYAEDDGVPLTTFSFVARRKITRDRRAGRAVRLVPAKIGYPYLGLILATAGLGLQDLKWYFIGILFLTGWMLASFRREKARPWAWGLAYLGAVASAVMIAASVLGLYQKYARFVQGEANDISRQIQTSLGQVVDLKLSPDIQWRYQPLEGARPARLRTAVYNTFALDRWKARVKTAFRTKISQERSVGGDFEMLFSDGVGMHQNHVYEEGDFLKEAVGSGILRGRLGESDLLPVPTKALRFEAVPVESLEVNSLGTTQVTGPLFDSIAVRIANGRERMAGEQDPSIRDLEIPEGELEGIDQFWFEQAEPMPLWDEEEMIARMESLEMDEDRELRLWAKLQQVFYQDFRYTLNLKPKRGEPAISFFLNEMKAGHCEYFASASALLLRRAGIATRYCVGFAMAEKSEDGGEWIIRGKHAHAWAQAYLGGTWRLEQPETPSKNLVWRCRGGRWVDIDLTPPDWLNQMSQSDRWKQRLSDWWQMLRQDALILLGKPLAGKAFKVILWVLGFVFMAWLLRQIWRSRRRKTGEGEEWLERCGTQDYFGNLERWLAKRIGPRPPGMTFGDYLEEYEAAELIAVYHQARYGGQQTHPRRLHHLAEKLKGEVREASSNEAAVRRG